MQAKQKDKMISGDEAKNKQEQPFEDYHFAGGGEYEPLAVQARSREEAEEIWRQKRTKVESNQAINE